MPFSSESGKRHIKEILAQVKKDTILDIGAGSGTYAKLFPKSKFTGIEVWTDYVDKYRLRDLYSNLIVEDARKVDYASLGKFDVAIAGDVLEHMSEDEAKELLLNLRDIADTVVISIPIGYYPQDEYEGNPYERHITDNWTDKQVREVFGEPTFGYIEKEIGVYAWLKNPPLKKKLKICVYGISKNEEKFVERWAKSAVDADLILLADTGSTDRTCEIARNNGVQVHEICITPWRFDHARNVSLALVPRDIDVCISLDVDEVLEPGWREEIESTWVDGTTRLRYLFDWGKGKVFQHEKIHARHGYHWHHPCHEIPRADKRITENFSYTQKLLVSHYPDDTKSRGQYLDLLKLSVEEDPFCPRNAWYYARELYYYRRWDEAIEGILKYLDMPNSLWKAERSYSMRVMAECYSAKGNKQKAEEWLHRATVEDPSARESWIALSDLTGNQRRWELSFAYAMQALSITKREYVYTSDPNAWGWKPHDLAAIAAYRIGLYDLAIEQGKIALSFAPDDKRLKSNMDWYLGQHEALAAE